MVQLIVKVLIMRFSLVLKIKVSIQSVVSYKII